MRVPAAVRHQEMNPAKLPGLFLKQFVLSKVCAGETMVLLSDMTTRLNMSRRRCRRRRIGR